MQFSFIKIKRINRTKKKGVFFSKINTKMEIIKYKNFPTWQLSKLRWLNYVQKKLSFKHGFWNCLWLYILCENVTSKKVRNGQTLMLYAIFSNDLSFFCHKSFSQLVPRYPGTVYKDDEKIVCSDDKVDKKT